MNRIKNISRIGIQSKRTTTIALLATVAAILLATAIVPALGRVGTSSHVAASADSDPIATGNWQYDQYDSIIVAAAQQYGLNPFVLKGQIMLESGFNQYAQSSVINWGCGGTQDLGLMQINPYCSGYSYSTLMNAWSNINIGAQIMGQLNSQFGSIDLALQAYNIGSASIQAGLTNWAYSNNVMNWAQTFQNEHNALYGSSSVSTSQSSSGSSSSSGSWTYTVQPGDYLYKIGQQNGVSWESIAQANGISSPYIIYVGQQLTIP